MALLNPIYRGDDSNHNDLPQVKNESIGVNFSFFNKNNKEALVISDSSVGSATDSPKRGPGRPRKGTKTINGEVIVTGDQDDLPQYQSNAPYIDTYGETNNLLRSTIGQVDQLNTCINTELDGIISSKTLKGKYQYISELSGTSSSLLSTKISAIREINKTITDCHNLDMKRIKELKIGQDEGNDDKKIMDMYNAFISTPMGDYNPLGPSMADITLPNGALSNMIRSEIGEDYGNNGYNGYLNSMTPEQNRMRSERNPNIKTVVIYDQGSGDRYFDVIDTITGQSIPNMPKPGAFILEDLQVNLQSGTARNSNIDADYSLIVVGANRALDEY